LTYDIGVSVQFVDIAFDCIPLRSIGRLNAPLDASPEVRARSTRIAQAISRHGVENTYYLANAYCAFHLANSEIVGLLRFTFEGTVRTDVSDAHAESVDLEVTLAASTCDWLTPEAEAWFRETVRRAAAIEFDRYITSGALARHVDRLQDPAARQAAQNSFLGMDV
jgi:hypothetical protein